MLKEKVVAYVQNFQAAHDDENIMKVFDSLFDLILNDVDNEIKHDSQMYKSILTALTNMENAVKKSRLKYYIKSFRYIYSGNKSGYFTSIEKYISQYKTDKVDFTYESAYINILEVIYCFIKDDETYASYMKRLLTILNAYMPESAFCAYVKYLTKTYQNPNIHIKTLQRILEIDENWYVARVHLGDVYYDQKKWLEAIECYEIAISSCDLWETAPLYFVLALCYDSTKQYVKSTESYKKCLEIEPNYRYANSNLAYVYRKMKEYDNAIQYIDKSIELEGVNSFNFQIKIEALVGAKRNDEAIVFASKYPKYAKAKHILKLLEKATGGRENMDDIFLRLEQTTENTHAGTELIVQGNSGVQLYAHQQDAIRNMNRTILKTEKYSGLLVLPTGGGKTLTATYWLMGNILDNGQKIIWLAHRHELLNQAYYGFKKVSYADIARRKKQYNYRIISGQHDKPVHIQSSDDVIIASKTSLHRGFSHLMEKWLSNNNNDVFLVIDEAHHATAKEYRELIEKIRKAVPSVKILGLTATPFRTADNEQGLLKKIFSDDYAYKIDLRELINRGILAKPIFEEVETEFDMLRLFQTPDGAVTLSRIEKDSFFDIESIGADIATEIAENAERNNAIVKQYVDNKDKYGKTLVFALNVKMAIALNAVFKAYGVKSDYVVSDIKDMMTGVTISSKENTEKIQKFRGEIEDKNEELQVLINVNILTEGTDLPKVQTVFLTRPTKSTILMTQMIGRALRGEEAGGTKEAYIVSFVDNWQSRIAWVNPEQLFIDENADFNDNSAEIRKMAMRLVAIQKIEEFAAIADGTLDERLEKINFIERIPIGIYNVKYLMPVEDDEDEAINRDILVYDCMQNAYRELFDWLPNADLQDIDAAAQHINDTLFTETDRLIGYREQDVLDIISYYKQTGEFPEFIAFTEREEYDVKRLAKIIVDEDWGAKKQSQFIEETWENSETRWSAFFGVNSLTAFEKLIENEKRNILRPIPPTIERPITQHEQRQIQDLPLYEIRQKFPELGEKIRTAVFDKFTDYEGYYYSAQNRYRSKNKLDFQIDHIIPMAKGGKTVLENLQLLTRAENMIASDKDKS